MFVFSSPKEWCHNWSRPPEWGFCERICSNIEDTLGEFAPCLSIKHLWKDHLTCMLRQDENSPLEIFYKRSDLYVLTGFDWIINVAIEVIITDAKNQAMFVWCIPLITLSVAFFWQDNDSGLWKLSSEQQSKIGQLNAQSISYCKWLLESGSVSLFPSNSIETSCLVNQNVAGQRTNPVFCLCTPNVIYKQASSDTVKDFAWFNWLRQ